MHYPMRQTSLEPAFSTKELRLILTRAAVDDIGLRRLCVDYFPFLLKHLSSSMSTESILNTMLERLDPIELYQAAQKCFGEEGTLLPLERVSQYSAKNLGPDEATLRRLVPPPRCAYDPNWYVARPEEEARVLEALEFSGAAVSITAPEGLGKTWMLEHMIQQLGARGRLVSLNMRAFGHVELLQCYSRFLGEIARQCLVQACGWRPERADESVIDSWRATQNPVDAFCSVLEEHVLPSMQGGRQWLLLSLDGMELLHRHPCLEEFFTLLRGLMEEAARPPWSALRLMMALSIPPRLLVKNIDQSPFNVATKIELPDFEVHQVRELVARHGLEWSDAELEEVMQLVGGHPLLLRHLLYVASRSGRAVRALLGEQSTLFAEHLQRWARWLEAAPGLYEALSLVADGGGRAVDFQSFDRLLHAGLITQNVSTREIRLRYAIYRALIRPEQIVPARR